MFSLRELVARICRYLLSRQILSVRSRPRASGEHPVAIKDSQSMLTSAAASVVARHPVRLIATFNHIHNRDILKRALSRPVSPPRITEQRILVLCFSRNLNLKIRYVCTHQARRETTHSCSLYRKFTRIEIFIFTSRRQLFALIHSSSVCFPPESLATSHYLVEIRAASDRGKIRLAVNV